MLLSVTGSGLCGLGVVVKQGRLPGAGPAAGCCGDAASRTGLDHPVSCMPIGLISEQAEIRIEDSDVRQKLDSNPASAPF